MKLDDMIESLLKDGVLSRHEADLAHHMREMRNIVHPREMLRSSELNENQCKIMISGLRKILQKRFEILENKNSKIISIRNKTKE
jgi:uncharacterized protein YutE (UPF0331/DUF86 family)